MTFHIVIDSTEYSGDPLRIKARFQALKRLAQAGIVKLHMPYVVKGELISHIQGAFDEVIGNGTNLRKGLETLEAINARNTVHELGELRDSFADALNRIDAVKERFAARVGEEVDEWLADLNATTYEISSEVAKDAFDAYFSGSSPFPAPKARIHIPDAFIYSQIMAISGSLPAGDELFLVSNDDNLRTKVESSGKNIKTFKHLHQFINQPSILQALHASNQYLSVNIDTVKQAIRNHSDEIRLQLLDSLADTLSVRTLKKHKMLISGPNTTLLEVIPEQGFEINYNEIEDYGNGILVLPVFLDVTCEFTAWVNDFEIDEIKENDIGYLDIAGSDEYITEINYSQSLRIDAVATATLDLANANQVDLTQTAANRLIEAAKFTIDEIIMIGT